MRVLLDTHVFLWWVEGDRALPAKACAAPADRENECLISLVSAWVLAIKAGLGKLKLALPVPRYVVEHVAANGLRMLVSGWRMSGASKRSARIMATPSTAR